MMARGASIGETVIGEAGGAPLAIAEAKAWLRITGAADDATIAGLIRAAGAMCEGFTGQLLIERECVTAIATNGAWQRLGAGPVRSIVAVESGAGVAIGDDGYEADIDVAGDGWVRMKGGGSQALRVRYRAGIAVEANGLPEGLRQGLMRMVAHLYAVRGGEEGGGGGGAPPAAVSALWRPWRRMRL